MNRCMALAVTTLGLFVAGCRSEGSGSPGPAPQSDPAAEKAAVAAAEAWLKLIDNGDHAGSWDSAAAYFRNAVGKGVWDKQIEAVRKPLGKVLSRSVAAKRYMTSAPGAPDGEYVVIQFNTSFENKRAAVETVTPMREGDGTWRVSGYYIK